MGTRKLVTRLQEILRSLNEPIKHYESAWLALEDDLTGRERYVLHIGLDATLSHVRDDERRFLLEKLWQHLEPDLLKLLSRIATHTNQEHIHLQADDIVVLDEALIH